jgi:hypothetical protein
MFIAAQKVRQALPSALLAGLTEWKKVNFARKGVPVK